MTKKDPGYEREGLAEIHRVAHEEYERYEHARQCALALQQEMRGLALGCDCTVEEYNNMVYGEVGMALIKLGDGPLPSSTPELVRWSQQAETLLDAAKAALEQQGKYPAKEEKRCPGFIVPLDYLSTPKEVRRTLDGAASLRLRSHGGDYDPHLSE